MPAEETELHIGALASCAGANSEPGTQEYLPLPADRTCSADEMLQYFLEMESSRQDLQRYAHQLKKSIAEANKLSKDAQRAVREKTDFLAVMSHEMRTPLNGIIGMTSILLSRALGEQERDCVEIIRSCGESLLAVIDDVLNLSKIEAGRLELEEVDFRPADVIGDSIQIVRGMANGKALSFTTSLDARAPASVRGDMARLRQILLNLLGNAVKFTPQGTIDVSLELKTRTHSAYELLFSVSDEGIGMTDTQLARIFRPFSQAEASTTRRFGGTGLGLAICKQLVEKMGGSIEVQSAPGKGSCFSFTVTMQPAKGDPVLSSLSATSETPSIPQPGYRLLLVDDNAVNRKVGSLMLKKLGHTVDLAENGCAALDAAAKTRYHLILMDCIMPEMDGFEATRRLRQTVGYTATIPVIAMTASAFEEDRDACFAAGMSGFLTKPVREAELRRTLEQWLPQEPTQQTMPRVIRSC
jgi:signal transduction histidine kinase/ActR/RegA family two-component response regulator